MKNQSIPQSQMLDELAQNQPKRAILYARVSGDDRKYATSGIESQLNDCRQYASQKGYRILDEVCEDPDKHTSGADWLPEMDRIVRQAAGGSFDVVVVREMDRFARDTLKRMLLENDLNASGVKVEYVIGQFEETAEGELLKDMVASVAEYERKKIKERTHRGKLNAVDAGNVYPGGSGAPYGYDVAIIPDPVTAKLRRQLVINPSEAAIVGVIFDLYAVQMKSLYEIKDYLEDRQVPKPGKGANHRKNTKRYGWSVGTLQSMLANETYIGRWHYHKMRRVKDPVTGKKRDFPRPREEWMAIAVPALISEEQFAAVKARREANKIQKGHQHKYDYLLGGMLVCGHCGCRMSGITRVVRGKPYPNYKCNARHDPKKHGHRCDNAYVAVADVDSAVWHWIASILKDAQALRAGRAAEEHRRRAIVQPQLAILASNQTKLEGLEDKVARIRDAYENGVYSLDEFAPRKTALDKDISQLKTAIAKLTAEIDVQLVSPERWGAIEEYVAKIHQGIVNEDDPQERRYIFQLLNVEVTISSRDNAYALEVKCLIGEQSVNNGAGLLPANGDQYLNWYATPFTLFARLEIGASFLPA